MKRSLQSSIRTDPLFITSGVALIAATYGLARLGFGLFLPAFSESFALTPALSGTLSSGMSILYCVAAGVGLRYAASHPRAVTLLAGVTTTVGSLGIAAAPSTAVFAAAVLLAGTGAGFASPALVDLVRRNAAPLHESRTQSIVNSGSGFGVIAAGAMSLVLGDAWRVAWLLVAVVAAAATSGVLHLDRASVRRPAVPHPAPAPRVAGASGASRPASAPRLSGLLPSSLISGHGFLAGLGRPLVGAVVLGGGSAAVWVYGRGIMEDEGGMTSAVSAGAWMALGVGGASAALLSPWLAARPLAVTWPATALVTACATALVGVLPGSLPAVLAGALLFGLAYTAATSVLVLWASATATNAAAGTSALFIALVLGQAAGAPLTGVMLESGPPALAFAAAALACAGAATAALGVRTPMTAGPAPRRGSR
jgi:predicted MFS family arabinose efflux permease